jgi:hypothetical protein
MQNITSNKKMTAFFLNEAMLLNKNVNIKNGNIAINKL